MSYDATTFLCTFLLCNCFLQYCICSSARDYVTTVVPLRGDAGETLVSAENKFVLGFFTPSNIAPKRWYIGIWYNSIDPVTVVWVANRDQPLLNRSDGIFTIDKKDGNLKLLNGSDELSRSYYFSTNLSSSSESRKAILLDTGNLVLINNLTGDRLWESFKNPTDTFLPGMKMDESLKLTSWKNREDPAEGNFTFQQDEENNGYKILNISEPHWKSTGRESNKGIFTLKMNPFADYLLSNFTSPSFSPPSAPSPTKKEINFTGLDRVDFTSTRFIMNFTGEIQYLSWDEQGKKWLIKWLRPKGPCGVYKACGVFGNCTETDKKKCECFPGFEPSSPDDWNSNDFSDGCKRKSNICEQNGGKDTFFNVTVINVENLSPFSKAGLSEQQCREECLKKCHCQAYSYSPTTRTPNNPRHSANNNNNKSSCLTSEEELTNIQVGYANTGIVLNIRVAATLQNGVENTAQLGGSGSQPGSNKSSSPSAAIISITVIIAIALFCSISYIAYIRMRTKKKETESIQEKPVFQLYDREIGVEDFIDQGDQFREDDKKDIDVPFFELESILAATDNFSQANKLGQGGFGPVYKGKFPGGKEFAVKRLSSNSVQGFKEFKNEVVLIAKLQHRNLVRLLGYCIMGNEKILLYEYMPNKSLDAFIFDEKLSMLLDWTKRFDIILGVARGILYLHQDSRLRIIHRDMKTSNILLDEEMNPKISDFGLARIVGGRETEATTGRVVGTYGYMSPEYVLEGQFSIKSDVFSFGVVVLEIISGKKNTGFYQSQLALNLLGYTWNLWKEEKPLALLDQTLVESCNEREVLKCIIIGLLCVQEDPGDRPNMSKVLYMLNSEMETLPNPKQPAFISRKRLSGATSSSSSKPETLTKNEITFSLEDGR